MLNINKRKLPHNSKNWLKAKKLEKCLIDRIRLIEYNWIRLYMFANSAIKRVEYIYIRDQIFKVKYKGWLIVRLKVIKSREKNFYYLSFYLYLSFF